MLTAVVALKGFWGNERDKGGLRRAIEQTQNTEWLRKKLLVANDYILTSEELVRTLEIVLLLLCASTVIVTGVNVFVIWRNRVQQEKTLLRCSDIRAFAWLSSCKVDPLAKTG